MDNIDDKNNANQNPDKSLSLDFEKEVGRGNQQNKRPIDVYKVQVI